MDETRLGALKLYIQVRLGEKAWGISWNIELKIGLVLAPELHISTAEQGKK